MLFDISACKDANTQDCKLEHVLIGQWGHILAKVAEHLKRYSCCSLQFEGKEDNSLEHMQTRVYQQDYHKHLGLDT